MRSRSRNPKSQSGLLGAALLSTMAVSSCGNEAALDESAPEETAVAARASALNSEPSGETDAVCSGVRADVPTNKRPADIIFVVDNSGSMADEALAIQTNINAGFADILSRSGLDYRVIIVARHGAYTGSSRALCITAPLSTHASCSPVPAQPGNNSPRFFHYSRQIESTDSLQRLLNTYNGIEKDDFGLAPMGWSQWLRTDTFKVFIEITDDESSMHYLTFDTQLLALTPKLFGDSTNRNYVFHSIAGFKENSPVTKPWGPADPIQTSLCTRGGGAVASGQQYQRLSILTGGHRYPICEHASFDAIFTSIANDLTAAGKYPCDFPLPTPPVGEKIDQNSVSLEYFPMGTGTPRVLKKVSHVDVCTTDSFYIDKDRVFLCPDTCSTVQRDSKAKVQIIYSCQPLTRPNGSACAAASECTSGFCADGVCCNTACGGGIDSDCQVCSKAKGGSADGTCGAAAAGKECRKSGGTCDVAEVCDGTALTCPSNKYKPTGQVCRAASGPCDIAETCSGTAVSCPSNKYASNLTVCRPSSASCDATEFCSGTASACPTDLFKPSVAICRPTVGNCDLTDYCTGGSPACPPDDVLPAGTLCRPQSTACDQQETCSGASPACPFDRSLPDGTSCPGGMCKAGMCI
jgi:hypothetical protein